MTKTTTRPGADSAMLYVGSVPASVAFYLKLGFELADDIEGVAIVTHGGGMKLHPLRTKVNQFICGGVST